MSSPYCELGACVKGTMSMSNPKNTPLSIASDDWPRVLVLTQYPFNRLHGGGIALTNYFDQWPKMQIAQACIPSTDLALDMSVCSTYFSLSEEELRPSFIWRTAFYLAEMRRRLFSRILVNEMNSEKGHEPYIDEKIEKPAPNAKKSLASRLSGWLQRHGWRDSTGGAISKRYRYFLTTFRPEIIFCVPGDIGTSALARLTAETCNCPLVVQMADDWMSHFPNRHAAGWVFQNTLHRELSATLKMAECRFSICDEMSDAFERRYGVDFKALLGPVDVSAWAADKDMLIDDTELFLTYAGTVHDVAQLQGLKDIAVALSRLKRQGIDACLRIVAPKVCVEKIQNQFEGNHVQLFACDNHEDVIAMVKQSSALLLPIEFNAVFGKFVRYSMPAKICAYAASGVPMLVYGPDGVPPIGLAKRLGIGIAVTSRDHEVLDDALVKVLTDRIIRKSISEAAYQFALSHCDRAVVAASFQRTLRETVFGRHANGS